MKPAKESAKAKKACEQYLLMGPDRSLAKLVVQLGHPPGYERTLKEWSTCHGWQDRCKEYDQEQASARRREIEEARREMDKEHALWGKEQALKAMAIIEEINAVNKFTSQAAVQLFKYATDLQRIAMGSATEQIAVTGKDGGPIETDVIVETFWGRGTDPRRKAEPVLDEPRETAPVEDPSDAEFSIAIPDDDEEP
jgi:hypothetical protein